MVGKGSGATELAFKRQRGFIPWILQILQPCLAQDGEGHEGGCVREEDQLREGSPAARLLSRDHGKLQSCAGNGHPGQAGENRDIHREHPQGTSVLQWPLKSPPNTCTCVSRQPVGQPKVRDTGEVTSCHKKPLQPCRSPQASLWLPFFFCRYHPEGEPVPLHLLSPQPSAAGSDGAAHQQSQQGSGNLASPAQEMCFVSALTLQGQSSSLYLIPWDLFLPQERAERRDEHQGTAGRREGAAHTQLPERLCAQSAPKILVCPLSTHCPLLSPTVLALPAL